MRTILFYLVLFISVTSYAGERFPQPNDWASKPQPAFFEKGESLSVNSFAEVRVTRIMTAVDRLKNVGAILLTEEMALHYIGSIFKMEAGRKPYLVRGLFANYTGEHTLSIHGDTLVIRHGSLGSRFESMFCPLVVNLSAEPKKVINIITGIK